MGLRNPGCSSHVPNFHNSRPNLTHIIPAQRAQQARTGNTMNKIEPEIKPRLDRGDIILGLIVLGAALVLFGRTVTPGLLPGYGGEFQTLTYLYGPTHPTGYPVT